MRPGPSYHEVEIFTKFGIPDPTVGGSSIYVPFMSPSVYSFSKQLHIHSLSQLHSLPKLKASVTLYNNNYHTLFQQLLQSSTLFTTHPQCVSNSLLCQDWQPLQMQPPSPANPAASAQPAPSPFKTPMRPSHPSSLKCLHKALEPL